MRKGVANPAEPRETRVTGKESGKEGSKEPGKDLGKEAGKAVCQEAKLEYSSKKMDNAQKLESVVAVDRYPLDPPEGGCPGRGVGPVAGVAETREIPGAAEARAGLRCHGGGGRFEGDPLYSVKMARVGAISWYLAEGSLQSPMGPNSFPNLHIRVAARGTPLNPK